MSHEGRPLWALLVGAPTNCQSFSAFFSEVGSNQVVSRGLDPIRCNCPAQPQVDLDDFAMMRARSDGDVLPPQEYAGQIRDLRNR